MVKKANIPQALLRYVRMNDAELHDIMEKNPYYTLPKIAYMLKTHQGIEEDNMELYAYDVTAIKELLSLHMEHLDDKVAERKLELERNKTIEPNITSTPSEITPQSNLIDPSMNQKALEAKTIEPQNEESNSETVLFESNPKNSTEHSDLNLSDDDMIMFDLEDSSNSNETKEQNELPSSEVIDLTDSSLSNQLDNENETPSIQKIEPIEEKNADKTESEQSGIIESSVVEQKTQEIEKTTPLDKESSQKVENSTQEETTNTNEKQNQSTDQMDFFSWLNSTQPKEDEKKNAEILEIETDDLEEVVQDPFFQSQIHTNEQKDEISIEEKAKISIKKTDLVSETLAKLYADQGELKKAKEMYLKLIDQFPEKSAYFASLIKKIN